MNLEDITLNTISQAQKDKYHKISLCVKSKNVKVLETEYNGCSQGLRGGKMGRCYSKGTKCPLLETHVSWRAKIQGCDYS
jgi:hypothetical protein